MKGAKLTATETDLPSKLRDTGIVILKSLPVFECSNCPYHLIRDAVLARVDEIWAAWTEGLNWR